MQRLCVQFENRRIGDGVELDFQIPSNPEYIPSLTEEWICFPEGPAGQEAQLSARGCPAGLCGTPCLSLLQDKTQQSVNEANLLHNTFGGSSCFSSPLFPYFTSDSQTSVHSTSVGSRLILIAIPHHLSLQYTLLLFITHFDVFHAATSCVKARCDKVTCRNKVLLTPSMFSLNQYPCSTELINRCFLHEEPSFCGTVTNKQLFPPARWETL